MDHGPKNIKSKAACPERDRRLLIFGLSARGQASSLVPLIRFMPDIKKISPTIKGTIAVNLPTEMPPMEPPPDRKAKAPQMIKMMPNIVRMAPKVLFMFIILSI